MKALEDITDKNAKMNPKSKSKQSRIHSGKKIRKNIVKRSKEIDSSLLEAKKESFRIDLTLLKSDDEVFVPVANSTPKLNKIDTTSNNTGHNISDGKEHIF